MKPRVKGFGDETRRGDESHVGDETKKGPQLQVQLISSFREEAGAKLPLLCVGISEICLTQE